MEKNDLSYHAIKGDVVVYRREGHELRQMDNFWLMAAEELPGYSNRVDTIYQKKLEDTPQKTDEVKDIVKTLDNIRAFCEAYHG